MVLRPNLPWLSLNPTIRALGYAEVGPSTMQIVPEDTREQRAAGLNIPSSPRSLRPAMLN
jgi:hypothetical protein